MVRRIAMAVVAASLVAAVIGGVSLAAASGHRGEDVSVRLLEVRTAVTPVDLPPTGASAGDEFVLAGTLRNAANTRDVGTANDVCTVLTSSGSPLHCVSVITLRAGTISLAGVASGGPHFTLAITGGTGAYDEVHGQLTGAPGPNGTGLASLDIDR
jgi:hypothetical protein